MSHATTTAELSREAKLALLAKLLAERSVRPRTFPLSFAQQRLWFLDQTWPQDPFYNLPTAVHLVGEVSHAMLERALNEIVRRHESLRTTFVASDEGPVQAIAPAPTLEIPVIELGPVPPEAREARARRLIDEHAREPFDLSRGPLVRAALFRADAREAWLLVTLHHIIADAWSISIFLRELAVLYDAVLAGRPSPLPELPIQYADFAQWQRRRLQGEVLARQLAYWKQQLADALPVIDLPSDRPRPSSPTHRGAHAPFQIGPELYDELRRLTQREGATIFMVLLAALAVLLRRYTGQEDVTIGTPIANRNRVELEPLIGFFVNTLPLRVDLSGDPGFRQLLARVRETTLAAYAHQDLPFEKLVEELRPMRDISRSPFFQVMLILHNAPRETLTLPGLALTFLDVEHRTAKFDLTFSLVDRGTHLDGVVEYSTDLFDRATIDRMPEHWHTLLASIVRNPDHRVSRLPLLSGAARDELVRAWNNTAAPCPDGDLADLFNAQAARTPSAVAVVCGDEQVTYAELQSRVRRLVRRLRRLGVGPERVVGLCIERSVDLVVSLLGVLEAGGAYLPLDPGQPSARLASILEDAAVDVWLTEQRWRTRLPDYRGRVVCIDASEPDDESVTEPQPTGDTTDRLAYVICTSGSSGRPKGVAITQRAAVNLVAGLRAPLALTSADVVLAVTTISFDIALMELYAPLTLGATVVIASRAAAVDGHELQALLHRHHVTLLQVTPTTWRLLLEAGWRGEPLTRVLCGGEALTRALADELLATGRAVWNLYGPTETTVWSTMARVDAGPGALTIGRPIANTQVYVVDRQLEPVPVGVVGELYIGGVGLARGYVKRPALTAARFVPDPFSGTAGARLYRTGDLARWRADGELECLGRIDHQVKLHGHRIEPAEIDAALTRHPAVREAAVVVREDSQDERRLVAYVVARAQRAHVASAHAARARPRPAPEPGEETLARELIDMLRQTLPEPMVPSAIVFLDRLPLLANGKLDRSALPAPPAPSRSAGKPPRTPHEELLCALIGEVLGVERVGVDDNFFELGGHSLLASRLANRVRAAVGIEFAVRTVLEAPSVSQLALRLGAGERTRTGLGPLLRLRPLGSRPPLVCLPPAGGPGWSYAGLMRAIHPARPIYCLQTWGLSDDAPPPTSLAATADALIAVLRKVQPAGPYHFLGWSFGGLVAHAMACRLQARGQQVALLAVLDAYPDVAFTGEEAGRGAAGGLIDRTSPDRCAHGLAAGEIERMSKMMAHRQALSPAFTPGRFEGDMLLFAAAGNAARAQSWTPHVSGAVASHELQCAHLDMAAPGPLQQIGRVLEQHFQRL